VFADAAGEGLHPETVSNAFVREVKRSGLRPIRLHDLRHTWASLAMTAGVHPKKVQRQLGHSHVSITLAIYSHLTDEDGQNAAEMVAGLIAPYGGDNVVPLRQEVDGE
jgi:integrase